MPGMLMSDRISTMSATPRCSSSCRARLGRQGEEQLDLAGPHLAPELLLEQRPDVLLVVDDDDLHGFAPDAACRAAVSSKLAAG